MKRIFLRIFYLCIAFNVLSVAYSQDISNKGTDFWIGYGNHIRMFNPGPPEKMQLYITSDINTSGDVNITGIGFHSSFQVKANETTIVDIPRSAALFDQGLYNHGIHVTAAQPVVVYSFIYVNSISGATVCLPTAALGNDYYSVNFDQVSNEPNAASYFFVIAADTGKTTVEITPSALTKSGQPPGVSFLVTLSQGQIYQVLGAVTGNDGVDLTGSRIRSLNSGRGCKRIAVFSGSAKVAIGCAFRSSDNLYQQMYPTSTWGRKYITVPGMINSNNLFRIIKSDPSATVLLNGVVVPNNDFVNNLYYQFTSNQPNLIESDKPILVAQYFPTQGCIGNPNPGDPEMIFLNPVEQTISHVTLNSLQPALDTDIRLHFLNVVVRNNAGAINTFRVDGIPYSTFIPVPSDTSYAYARITTSAGTHTITCDTGFNIIAYGFGNAESYGYSGGTHLKDLYQYASIQNEYAVVNYPATCEDAPFSFNMTFPYQPTQIEWKFKGLFPDEIQAAPVADSSWTINGRKLYFYKLKKIFKGPPPGSYPIRIIAFNPTPDGCTGTQEIDYELKVYEKPVADFGFTSARCATDTILFEDLSSPNPQPVINWIWDFSNGDSAFGKETGYVFKQAGKFDITFSYITDIGCVASEKKEIIIHPAPQPAFDISAPACATKDILFSDKSTIESGSVVHWSWTMGDGKTWQKNSSAPFTDTFAKIGTYIVTLQAESDHGCLSSVAKDVQVFPSPVAGFILPADCVLNPVFQFTDTSTIEDGTGPAFRYLWNFRDPGATSTNPDFSTLKDPVHKYSKAGLYPIMLTVTSSLGCADSVEQVFNLKAALPLVNVKFSEGDTICSDQQLTLVNHTTVSLGAISRFEIYWDYSADPTDKSVDDQPQPGKTYTKNYPVFYTPAEKQHTIYTVAYSDDNCLSTSSQIIKIKPAPQIVFDPLADLCENIPSFPITGARVINNMQGYGLFSGKGVSASGVFNPAVAGAGKHLIRYTFSAANECISYRDQQLTVYPIGVDAGPDKSINPGEEAILAGSARGTDVTYSWSPALALNDPASARPVASPADDIEYTLRVTTADGCKASDNVSVKVMKLPVVPNAFSPNKDGINDNWMIRYLNNYSRASVEVYNRYGQLVFRSEGYYKPWDGTMNGRPLPSGSYYYIINPGDGKKPLSGSVTIIR